MKDFHVNTSKLHAMTDEQIKTLNYLAESGELYDVTLNGWMINVIEVDGNYAEDDGPMWDVVPVFTRNENGIVILELHGMTNPSGQGTSVVAYYNTEAEAITTVIRGGKEAAVNFSLEEMYLEIESHHEYLFLSLNIWQSEYDIYHETIGLLISSLTKLGLTVSNYYQYSENLVMFCLGDNLITAKIDLPSDKIKITVVGNGVQSLEFSDFYDTAVQIQSKLK